MIKIFKINKDLLFYKNNTLFKNFYLDLYKISLVLILTLLLLESVFINKKYLNYVIAIPENIIVDKTCSDWINRLKIISLEHFNRPLTINKLQNEFLIPVSDEVNSFLYNSLILNKEYNYQQNNPCKINNINQSDLNYSEINRINYPAENNAYIYSEYLINENKFKTYINKSLISIFFITIIFLFGFTYFYLKRIKQSFYISDLFKLLKKFLSY